MPRSTLKAAIASILFSAGLAPHGTYAADLTCMEVERNATYWVFGETSAFNTWRKLCAEGKSAVEALLGSQARDPGAQAAIRQCRNELTAALAARRLDTACSTLARDGIPKAAEAVATASTPAISLSRFPSCLAGLDGKFKEVSIPDSGFFKSEVKVDSQWQMKDGMPYWTWRTEHGQTGKGELVGTDGANLVFKSSDDKPGSAPWSVKIQFDQSCESYKGTWKWHDRTGAVSAQKISQP